MAEIIETNETTTTPDNNMYIDTINELKQTTVSKAQYEQVLAENKKLLDSLANGDYSKPVEPEKPKHDLDKLCKEWQATFGMNGFLEPCRTALAYRDAYLEDKGIDIMVGNAHNSNVEHKAEAYESANNAAEVIRSCIEDCGGSDKTFFSLLCDRTAEDPTLLRWIADKNKKFKK